MNLETFLLDYLMLDKLAGVIAFACVIEWRIRKAVKDSKS